ncbi:MAG: tripartite tricarboxylate transporter substrate binding protein [Burkholderiales bacterium]
MRQLLIALLACLVTGSALASYPERPVRLITPFPPGGATDLLARTVGERLSQRLRQAVVIENRPGAGGNVGAELASRAAPDGYTLLMAPTSIYAVSETLYPRLNYDLRKDFTPVSLVANAPHVLLVHPSLPVETVAQLVAYAKARPGELNFASQGSGTVSHLEAEMFKSMAGIDLLHIPYRGSAPAVLDLLAGRVHAMFDSIVSSQPHIRAGTLRPLAVASPGRSPLLPDVPTMDEAGQKGYSAHSWLGILVPAGTPRAIVQRLHRDLVAAIDEPRTRAKLIEHGFEPATSTPAELAKMIREEIAKWAPLVKQSGATPD